MRAYLSPSTRPSPAQTYLPHSSYNLWRPGYISVLSYCFLFLRLFFYWQFHDEVVSGEGHLIDLIDSVVGNRFGALDGVLGRLGDAVDKYLPRIAEGQNKPVVLDTGAAVGGLGKPMNRQLNIYAEREKWQ